LWTLDLKSRETRPFDAVVSTEPIGAVFSPDGKWVAYARNDRPGGVPSPDRGVYVQPFPPTGDRYQVPKISRDFHPIWPSPNQLLFTPTIGRLSVTTVQTKPELKFLESSDLRGVPNTERLSTDYRDVDVAADNRIVAAISLSAAPQYRVVLNWFEELKRRLPER